MIDNINISHKADTAFFIPHAQRKQGICDRAGVHLYICMYICVYVSKKV